MTACCQELKKITNGKDWKEICYFRVSIQIKAFFSSFRLGASRIIGWKQCHDTVYCVVVWGCAV